MINDERRKELLDKANSLIDTISESMRMVENVEAAKKKFLRPDSALSLELPIEGVGGMVDVFKLHEIFDDRGIEKIKAYILTELEFLEEQALRILDTAGFHDLMKKPVEAKTEEPSEPIGEPVSEDPEDDSDMIIIPDKVRHSTAALSQEKVEQINRLASEGVRPADIAKQTGVSYNSANRYTKKFMETVPNGKTDSGRSVSKC